MINIEQTKTGQNPEKIESNPDAGKLKLARLELRVLEEEILAATDPEKIVELNTSLQRVLITALRFSNVPEEQEELKEKMAKLLPTEATTKGVNENVWTEDPAFMNGNQKVQEERTNYAVKDRPQKIA